METTITSVQPSTLRKKYKRYQNKSYVGYIPHTSAKDIKQIVANIAKAFMSSLSSSDNNHSNLDRNLPVLDLRIASPALLEMVTVFSGLLLIN